MYNNPSNAYREMAVQTSSPARLVVMLYEGAIRFLRESVSAIQSKDLAHKRHCIDRAVAVVQHLESTLDLERGGQVAVDLGRLYSYVNSRILEGSTKLDVAPLEEAIKLLNVLLTGWEGIANREGTNTVPPTVKSAGGFQLHG